VSRAVSRGLPGSLSAALAGGGGGGVRGSQAARRSAAMARGAGNTGGV